MNFLKLLPISGMVLSISSVSASSGGATGELSNTKQQVAEMQAELDKMRIDIYKMKNVIEHLVYSTKGLSSNLVPRLGKLENLYQSLYNLSQKQRETAKAIIEQLQELVSDEEDDSPGYSSNKLRPAPTDSEEENFSFTEPEIKVEDQTLRLRESSKTKNFIPPTIKQHNKSQPSI